MNLPEPINRHSNNEITIAAEAVPPAADASPMQMGRLSVFLKRFWWISVVTLLSGMAAGFLYLRLTPRSYLSTAYLWETEQFRLPEGDMLKGDAQNYFGTQVELLQSGLLMGRAMQQLQGKGTNILDKNGKIFPTSLSIIQVPNSSILRVALSSTDPAFAQAYLQSLLTEYIDFNKSLRQNASDNAFAAISDQSLHLETELRAEQDALTSFEKTNNLSILQEEGTVAGGYLARLNTELSEKQLELRLLDGALKGGYAPAPGTLETTGSGSNGDKALDLQSTDREIALLKLERDRFSTVLRPKHPRMIKLNEEIDHAQKLSDLLHAQNENQINAAHQALVARIGELETSVKEWEIKVARANAEIAEADRLKLNVHRDEEAHDRYLGILQNINLNKSLDREPFSILQSASPAVLTQKLQRERAMEIAAGGFVFGLAIIFLLAWRDDRFTSCAEASQRFGDVIIGQVPRMKLEQGQSVLPLVQSDDHRPNYAESYRSLRSALIFMPNSGERAKVVLVTSAVPHEGKSTIAVNLARVLALGGSRTLLIDADLRQGFLHKTIGLNAAPGLSDLLNDPEGSLNAIQSNCLTNFSFISRAPQPARPGDLFIGPALGLVLSRLREQFDFIIIDTSPVFAPTTRPLLRHEWMAHCSWSAVIFPGMEW